LRRLRQIQGAERPQRELHLLDDLVLKRSCHGAQSKFGRHHQDQAWSKPTVADLGGTAFHCREEIFEFGRLSFSDTV
jgi:hypothetical protein